MFILTVFSTWFPSLIKIVFEGFSIGCSKCLPCISYNVLKPCCPLDFRRGSIEVFRIVSKRSFSMVALLYVVVFYRIYSSDFSWAFLVDLFSSVFSSSQITMASLQSFYIILPGTTNDHIMQHMKNIISLLCLPLEVRKLRKIEPCDHAISFMLFLPLHTRHTVGR